MHTQIISAKSARKLGEVYTGWDPGNAFKIEASDEVELWMISSLVCSVTVSLCAVVRS